MIGRDRALGGRVLPVGRRGEELRDLVQRRLNADVARGADGEDRDHRAGGDAALEGRCDLVVVEVLALEVLHHDVVVGVGGGLDQLLARRLDVASQLLGGLGGLAGAGRLLFQEVVDALDAVGAHDRQPEGGDAAAEALAELLHDLREVGVLAVEAGDQHHARLHLGDIEARPGELGAGLDAGDGVDGDQCAIGGGGRGRRPRPRSRDSRARRSG